MTDPQSVSRGRPSPTRPDVSVIIVSWNVVDDVLTCLASLTAGPPRASFDIWVVDNASQDDTVGRVRAEYPEVRLIVNESNAGFAPANNQALRESTGRYALLTNPDTIFPPGGLDQLIAVAEEHPEAGAVGPRLVYPDGSLQHSCRRFPRPAAALFRGTLFGRLFPRHPLVRDYLMEDWEHDELREVDWLSGACVLLRREALEGDGERAATGLLDEQFFWGSEDVDLCYRLWQADWRVLYTPEPVVVHAVGRSSSQVIPRATIDHHRSMYRLYAKHFCPHFAARWLMAGLIAMRAAGILSSYGIRRLLKLGRAPGRRRESAPE